MAEVKSCENNGPLRGKAKTHDQRTRAAARSGWPGDRGPLCRCGQSASKPSARLHNTSDSSRLRARTDAPQAQDLARSSFGLSCPQRAWTASHHRRRAQHPSVLTRVLGEDQLEVHEAGTAGRACAWRRVDRPGALSCACPTPAADVLQALKAATPTRGADDTAFGSGERGQRDQERRLRLPGEPFQAWTSSAWP